MKLTQEERESWDNRSQFYESHTPKQYTSTMRAIKHLKPEPGSMSGDDIELGGFRVLIDPKTKKFRSLVNVNGEIKEIGLSKTIKTAEKKIKLYLKNQEKKKNIKPLTQFKINES